MSQVLVDTSVWIRHFKTSDVSLCELLDSGRVVTHEFVIEELALGGITERDRHYHLLCLLQRYSKVSHAEVLEFIQKQARKKRFRVGLVDSYLLCSALVDNLLIYSDDSGLRRAAGSLGVSYSI
jgi:predicted nucleic acid-binding protein